MKKKHLSYSALSQFKKSPNHLLAYWNKETKRTDAMLFGSLLHKLLLQPETFDYEYVVYDGASRRGKAWEQFKEHHATKEIIKQSELDKAQLVLDNIMLDPIFMDIVKRTGETEKEVNWTEQGVKFKGFVDMVGDDFIADVKTCTDCMKLKRELYYNDYKLQAAMYLENYPPNTKYYIIAVEKNLPYNVKVFKLGENMLEAGYLEYITLTKQYNEWDGMPQGYANTIEEISFNE
jgi:exodeoxyribonuclease VIII